MNMEEQIFEFSDLKGIIFDSNGTACFTAVLRDDHGHPGPGLRHPIDLVRERMKYWTDVVVMDVTSTNQRGHGTVFIRKKNAIEVMAESVA